MEFKYRENSFFKEGTKYFFKTLDNTFYLSEVVNNRGNYCTLSDGFSKSDNGIYKASSIKSCLFPIPNITLIMAISKNGVVGRGNDLPWRLKNDLIFFKKVTLNSTIIMGYNTFKSLPFVLPKRKHIVLTSKKLKDTENVIYLNSIESIIEYLNGDSAFLIGGANLAKKFIRCNLINDMIISHINSEVKGDVKLDMKIFDFDEYEVEEIDEYDKSDLDEYPFSIKKYFKK